MTSMINPALLAAGAIAAMGLAAKKSISAFVDFEDAMAGVKKTTGMSDEAIASLGEGIKELTKTIPLAHTELADIAAVAGQLGIQGKENILAFTDTAAKMATAFDMPAEKAATVAAKLTNIYGLGIEKASNLASAINVLGNTTAASESQISDYAMSLGASAVNMGFSSTESVAMGASLISMGMDASDAGTRLNAAFVQMGTKVEELSGFLGMTQEEFQKSFGEDPMAMLMQITEKLGNIEDPLERARVSSELFGRVGGKAITGLGGNLEGLQTNLDNAAQGFIENTSLEEEFAAKTDTLKAKFQFLRNALSDAAITIGTALAPYVEKLVIWFTDMVPVIIDLGKELKERLTPAFNRLRDFLVDVVPRVLELARHIWEKLQPAFESMRDIGESLGKIFGILTSNLGSNEDAFATLTVVADVVATVLNVVAKAIAYVIGWFAEHPKITKFAAIALAAFVLINPLFFALTSTIGLITAAIALLAVAWDRDWLGIKTTALKIVDAISAVIEVFIAALTTAIQVFLALLKGDWEGAWDAIKTYIIEWGPQIVTTVKNIGKAVIEALVNGIKAALGALWDIITGSESVTSTIVKGIKSIAPKAKVGGEKVSEGIADGIKEKENKVAASVESVTGTISTEFNKAPSDAKQAGNSTALAMADGIKSGTSAVSAAARSIVSAAMAEINKLRALAAAEKSSADAARTRAESAAKNIPEGTLDIVGKVIEAFETTESGLERARVAKTGTIGTSKKLTDVWEGQIEDITEKYYITESAWQDLTGAQQQEMADNIIAIIADEWKKSVKVGRKGGSNLYKRFIKEIALLSPEERELANLTSEFNRIRAEIEHLASLGLSQEGTELTDRLIEIQAQIDQLQSQSMRAVEFVKQEIDKTELYDQDGMWIPTPPGEMPSRIDIPSAATGGFVAQDTGLNVHKGEWVIPTKGGPVMTGGKDVTVNMTYNIDGVVFGSELERMLEKHDQELFKRLRSLV